MIDDLGVQLARLGLSAEAVALYTHLLETGPSPVARLAEVLGNPAVLRREIEHLVNLGMVSQSSEPADMLDPIDPTIGLELLAGRRQNEITAARTAAAAAYETYRRCQPPRYPHDLLEVVTGESVRPRVRQLERTAQEEVTSLDTAPYGVPLGENPIELNNLARGVRYRMVYARQSIADPDYYGRNVVKCIDAGEQARVLPVVPVKLLIVDRCVASVSLSIKEADLHHTMLVVRGSSLLSALIALFESCWQAASPLYSCAAPAPRLRPVEQRILQLLAAGMTDEAIARMLGLSRRTVSRHLGRLTTLTGAVNRFQLALEASREGWV